MSVFTDPISSKNHVSGDDNDTSINIRAELISAYLLSVEAIDVKIIINVN